MKLSKIKRSSEKSAPKNSKNREPRSKTLVRIIALILVLLMLGGTLFYVLDFLLLTIYAQEYNPALMIRVGLMYGNNVTVGFETTAEYGFVLGYVDSRNRFTALTQVTDTALSVTCDSNLSNNNRTFAKTDSASPSVGGYHIQVSGPNLHQFYDSIAAMFQAAGYAPFPAYINGEFCIRAGSFGTAEAVVMTLQSLPESIVSAVSGMAGSLSVAAPSATAVSAVNPYTNVIVFEFDSTDRSMGLGMQARQIPGAEPAYLVTPAKNKYEGIFEFKRNYSSYIDGVALTNIVTLEQYTLGVLPYEIGANWPHEAQKAFAVAVRSYVLSHLGKHNRSYGFDVCNSVDCQVYKGIGGANDNVRAAVAATAGQVLVYGGKVAKTFFSSSTGGTTVSAADAWGSNPAEYPYLAAKPTPWEHYAEHNYGEWTVEITPTQLYNTLVSKGYTLLRGPIASVKINSLGQNSTYVTSITFTDVYGTAVTINRSDTIRTVLGAYVRSANFQVALAGQTVVLTDYYYVDAVHVFGMEGKSATTINAAPTLSGTNSGAKTASYILPSKEEVVNAYSASGNLLAIITSSGLAAADAGDKISVITSNGPGTADTSGGSLTAQTSTGKRKFILPDESELNGGSGSSSSGGGWTPTGPLPKLSTLRIATSIRYVKASGSPGSFVFIGRGYGHGVGMSQWGVYDLAKLGYGYIDILEAYYTGTTVADYRTVTAQSN